VPRLRRWMPPTQLRKADLVTQEFWQSRLIQQSSNPTKFPRFPCFPWTKNGLWALAHAKSFRVFRG
jgi:hypothetical protein